MSERDFMLTSVADAPCNARADSAPSQSRADAAHDLVLLMEEAGEVVQAAAKAIRFGLDHSWPDYHDGAPNWVVVAREVGDLLAIVDRLALPKHEIENARERKHAKLRRFGPEVFGYGMLAPSVSDEQPKAEDAQAAECAACQRGGEAETPLITAKDAEIERLKQERDEARTALLNQTRRENGCVHVMIDPERCTGWGALQCGCAEEARAFLSPQGERP